jgi:hypothetical protein
MWATTFREASIFSTIEGNHDSEGNWLRLTPRDVA